MGGREIRNKIKGGSSLKPYGVKLLKCLNIFDAKHDFFKINKSGEHLKKYICICLKIKNPCISTWVLDLNSSKEFLIILNFHLKTFQSRLLTKLQRF